MKFTVVIPTRNRPHLVQAALESVLRQTSPNVDIVVVNDGSDESFSREYQALEAEIGSRARFFHLPTTPRGHGSSYALNHGARQAMGEYLCFLDDDDEWTDPDYLSRVRDVLEGSKVQVDLHLANQRAFLNGKQLDRMVWIEDLKDQVQRTLLPDQLGAYTITPADLLHSNGFCHLNTTIIRREFFNSINGLDDDIRYENDREFYLRAIDRARLIKYSPMVVSRHNVPDPGRAVNLSTSVSDLEKLLYQVRVLDKTILFSRTPELKLYGKQHKVYALKRIASQLAADGANDLACYYAREALLIGFNFRWLAFYVLCRTRRWFRPGTQAQRNCETKTSRPAASATSN
jgi:glycosyltransferase involved in cell wall biosynthesis